MMNNLIQSFFQPLFVIIFFTIALILFLIAIWQFRRNFKEKATLERLVTKRDIEAALVSGVADGVFAVDTQKRIIIFNKAAEEMSSWATQDALGLRYDSILKFKDDQDCDIYKTDDPFDYVWKNKKNLIRSDLYFINQNKQKIQVSASFAPLNDAEGKLIGAVCVFRDITKEKEVERLRSEFVSTASHELRTPITALEGYISLISDPNICQTDEKAQEFLKKAHHTIIEMSHLMSNLLSVTKIEEGKLPVQRKIFDLTELTKTAVSELEVLAKNKGLTLTFNPSKLAFPGQKALTPILNVNADPDQIREILNNLIGNAVKFTKEGRITVSLDKKPDFAIVLIEDTGVGIPPEDIAHIFEKFYRVDTSYTREVGGTGLGLYIVRSIVELFGGKIWLESTPGKGSKFYFTVPLAK